MVQFQFTEDSTPFALKFKAEAWNWGLFTELCILKKAQSSNTWVIKDLFLWILASNYSH